jgi:heptosyltransferase III
MQFTGRPGHVDECNVLPEAERNLLLNLQLAALDRPKFLLIRRDNIGDLVCTTPSILALRREFPQSRIDLLVNGYNADAVVGLPELDTVHVYYKSKHGHFRHAWQSHYHMMQIFRSIRRERYDVAIGVCGQFNRTTARFTLFSGARHRIGYGSNSSARSLGERLCYTRILDPPAPDCGAHEVELSYRLLAPLGIHDTPGPMKLAVRSEYRDEVRNLLLARNAGDSVVALHISSRKPENRWTPDNFIEFARRVSREEPGTKFLVLWAPGDASNPYHPGDDLEALKIGDALQDRAIPYRTDSLPQLIAAMGACKAVVCGDGGAMHIAAALQRPVVAVFGSSTASRWRPWGTKCELLQKGRKADDNTVEEVCRGYGRLTAST